MQSRSIGRQAATEPPPVCKVLYRLFGRIPAKGWKAATATESPDHEQMGGGIAAGPQPVPKMTPIKTLNNQSSNVSKGGIQ